MEMKKFCKVVFFLVTYLICSIAMASHHGCEDVVEKRMRTSVVGEASRDEFGNCSEKKKKVKFTSSRKLASGPSRRGCGH
ncbi:hypothetical protein EUTSA_v10021983mg [Eutrema salsugineum]|uniref:Transmembrane protein n=1 Tax=Eutrema salsugineum TaxID=72664 RepID=V4M3H0_EUTSA|nr:uncharacterized protein LOC18023606 [Eutrema salsugineum]ESQ49437.1 hypothetical protein EUTSA_v10021983mg [Eutrema salsugineum]